MRMGVQTGRAGLILHVMWDLEQSLHTRYKRLIEDQR